jgi:P4 family phage/plasmid primase-like protien
MMVSIPARLQTDQFRFILLQPKDKKPIEAKWTVENNYKFNDPKLASHIAAGGNYGVLCGPENLVVIDADDSVVRAAVESNLPPTFTVMTGRMGSHYYYKTDMQVSTSPLTDDRGKNVGHIKAGGGQVVGPSSLHPNGSEYALHTDLPIATVRAENLLFALRGFLNEDKTATETRRSEAQRAPEPLKGATVAEIMEKYFTLKGEPPGFKRTLDGYIGPHPVHGSTTGCNFHVNTRQNYWYCFRCGTGGGPLSLVAILEGIMRCEHARSGAFRGELFLRALELAEKKYGLLPSVPPAKQEGGGNGTPGFNSQETGTPSEKLLPCDVAETLMEEEDYVTSLDTDELYIYKDGVYVPVGESLIKDRVVALHPDRPEHFSNEVCFQIRSRTHKSPEEFNPDPYILVLNNGLLDVRTDGPLAPFTSEKVYTIRVPVTYDPSAECPRIMKFLSEVLRAEDIPVVQEIIGYCLFRTYRVQKAVMMTGAGANGKGVLLHMLAHFLGPDNISAVSLQDLEGNRFKCAEMYMKLANIYADLSQRALGSLGIFKLATGEDWVEAERKFGQPFRFRNYAKMLFSANKVPEIKEDTDAVYRRWLVIDFPNSFYGEKRDVDLLSKLITPEEMSGLLNWALEGLRRLLDKGDFSKSPSTEEVRVQYQRMASPLKAFVDDCIIVNPDSWISKEDLFREFMEYCDHHKLPKPSKTVVGRDLPRYAPSVRDERQQSGKSRERGWGGIGFKKDGVDRDREERREEKPLDDWNDTPAGDTWDAPSR